MPKRPKGSLFIGIDPGKSGGIACITSRSREYALEKMPPTDRDIWDTLKSLKDAGAIYAVLEKVHSMPGQGVKSTFSFGQSFGKLEMALAALEIPYEYSRPAEWMKKLKCGIRGSKANQRQFKTQLKAQAQRLFPESTVTLATADALLIAEYCRRVYLER